MPDDIDQLWARLREQRELLRTSIRLIDEGHWPQALLAAVTVRVLVHDTSKSKSLLSQLGVKSTILWWGYPTLRDGVFGLSMVSTGFGSGIELAPYRDVERMRPADFDSWWNGVPLRGPGGQGSRKDVVLALANNDGGGHVDLGNRLLAAVRASAPQAVETGEAGQETAVAEFSRALMLVLMRSILTEVDFSLTQLLEPGGPTPDDCSIGFAAASTEENPDAHA